MTTNEQSSRGGHAVFHASGKEKHMQAAHKHTMLLGPAAHCGVFLRDLFFLCPISLCGQDILLNPAETRLKLTLVFTVSRGGGQMNMEGLHLSGTHGVGTRTD